MSVELVAGQEVFEQPVDGITSPPYGPARQAYTLVLLPSL